MSNLVDAANSAVDKKEVIMTIIPTTPRKKKTRWMAIWLPIAGVVVLAVAIVLGVHSRMGPAVTSDGPASSDNTASSADTGRNSANDIVVAAGQSSFSIDLSVDEDSAYAGIEFSLTLSDESAVVFTSFDSGLPGAYSSPFMTKNGEHYFGFYAGTNAFPAGESAVGTLAFTGYSGDQNLVITVDSMKVTRLNQDNTTVTDERDSPAFVFTVHR